jgi:DNA-binding MarR family transcriptional regulator
MDHHNAFHDRVTRFIRADRIYKRVFSTLEFLPGMPTGEVNALRVLREIADVDSRPVGQVAERLALGESLTSRLIAQLQRRGHVEFAGIAHWDRRIKLFAATVSGKSMANDYAEDIHARAQGILVQMHYIDQGRLLSAIDIVATILARSEGRLRLSG